MIKRIYIQYINNSLSDIFFSNELVIGPSNCQHKILMSFTSHSPGHVVIMCKKQTNEIQI